MKRVIDWFVYDLTVSGENPPVEHELPDEHGHYFTNSVSVMSLVRYVTLKPAMQRGNVHRAGIKCLLKQKWVTNSGFTVSWPVGRRKQNEAFVEITKEGKHQASKSLGVREEA